MAELTQPAVKQRRLGRKLALVGGALLVLLVVAYFVATSAAFLKGVVLPRVSTAVHATVTVEDARLSPFSSVSLRGLKVVTTGTEPLLQASEVRTGYSLAGMLGGNIKVNEVTLVAPVVNIVQNADGTSNLDPLFVSDKKSEDKPKTTKTGKTPQLQVRNISLQNATVRLVKNLKGGGRQIIELANVNLTLDELRNAATTKLSIAADLKSESGAIAGAATNDLAQAKITASLDLALTADLLPQSIKAKAQLDLSRGQGQFKDLAGLGAALECDLSMTELKQFSVSFAQGGKPLGQIRASGPADLLKKEARLKLELLAIDRQILNVAGAPMGLDFGSTTINTTSQIELAKNGDVLNAVGQFDVGRFSVTQKGLTTPALDLKVGYNISVDQTAQSALVRTFTLGVTQNQKPLLTGSLSQPMKLDWGKSAGAVEDSALELAVSNLNLADWRAFLGTNVTAGQVSLTLNLLSKQAGKSLALEVSSQALGLAANFSGSAIEQADASLRVRGQMDNFNALKLDEFSVQLAHQKQAVASVSGSGSFALNTRDADLQTKLEASLPKLASLLELPGFAANSGQINFSGRLSQKNLAPTQTNSLSFNRTVAGNLQLENFTGRYASNRFDRFAAGIDLDVAMKNQLLEIRKFAGELRQTGQAGGRFEVNGNFDLNNQAGQLALNLTDLNQHALTSFLAPALGEMKLSSVSINANTTARYDAKGESAIKGDLQVVNLLITDPKKQLPETPLTASVKLDGTLRKGILDVRQFVGNVRLGELPGGSFDVAGKYDLTNSAGQVALKLTELNQNALRPFLGAALGDKTLTSVSINASANASYDAKGASSVKADVQITNLLLNDPAGNLPKTTLAAGVQLDGSLAKQILDLRQFQLTLTPTSRAKNVLQLTGKLDLTQTNATAGSVKLTAESLDLTPYYDLFDEPSQKKSPAKIAPASPADAKANIEPEAVIFPLRQFTLDANIGQLFLRDIAVANFIAAAKIDGGRINLKPLQFTINNAPVNASADLNLGVAGYQYDVALKADKIPVEPIANSFSPVYKGQANGDVFANLKITGAGVTGASLQKNLNGQIALSFTNANIKLVGPKVKAVLTPIALLLNIPEMLNSPLNYISADVGLGKGNVEVRRFIAHSSAFIAESSGLIPIAEVFTNSPLRQPIDISLPRALAKKFTISGTAPTAPYVKLPNFVKLEGTVGNPKAKTDKLVISGLVASGVAGAVGGKAGGILGEVGGILTGQPAGGTTQTNQTANPNAKPNKVSPLDLLKLIPKKK